MSPDLILQERHVTELRSLLARENSIDAAAYVLFGISEIKQDPWSKRRRRRYTSFEVLPVPLEDQVSADAQHVTWSTSSFVRLLKRSKDEQLVVGIVHTPTTAPCARPSSPSSAFARRTRRGGHPGRARCSDRGCKGQRKPA